MNLIRNKNPRIRVIFYYMEWKEKDKQFKCSFSKQLTIFDICKKDINNLIKGFKNMVENIK